MIGHVIAARERHRHVCPGIPVRFRRLRLGHEYAIDAIGMIEEDERIAYSTSAWQTERIEHRQLSFDLCFEQHQ